MCRFCFWCQAMYTLVSTVLINIISKLFSAPFIFHVCIISQGGGIIYCLHHIFLIFLTLNLLICQRVFHSLISIKSAHFILWVLFVILISIMSSLLSHNEDISFSQSQASTMVVIVLPIIYFLNLLYLKKNLFVVINSFEGKRVVVLLLQKQ